MGKGDRKPVRWAKDRERKKQARGKRNCFARYDLASLAVEQAAPQRREEAGHVHLNYPGTHSLRRNAALIYKKNAVDYRRREG